MAEVFIYGLPLIALIAAAFLVYYFFPAAFPPFWRHAHVPNQGVIRRDWVATGRIDFATPITKITSNPEDIDQPTEFKLLFAELQGSQPQMLAWLKRSLAQMPPKAYRWIAEMHEIADFVGEDPSAHELYVGAAHFYEQIARDFATDKTAVAALEAFLNKGGPS